MDEDGNVLNYLGLGDEIHVQDNVVPSGTNVDCEIIRVTCETRIDELEKV